MKLETTQIAGIGMLSLFLLFFSIYFLLGMIDLFPERSQYPVAFLDQKRFTLHHLQFWEKKPSSEELLQSQKCEAEAQQIADQKYSSIKEIQRTGEPYCLSFSISTDERVIEYQPTYNSVEGTTIPLGGSASFFTHPESCHVSGIVLYMAGDHPNETYEVVKSFGCYPGWRYTNLMVTKSGRIYFEYGGHGYTWNWIPGTESFYVEKK